LWPIACGLKFAGSFSDGILLKSEFSTKLQAAGVDATAYAAKLRGVQTSVIILNKDAVADVEVELDFGRGMGGAVETETLHATALDSRAAHITTSMKTDSLKQGKHSVAVPHATGLGLKFTQDAGTFHSSVGLLEVEVSEVHVAVRQYVYGENVLAFAERNFEKLRRQIPVVPLTPAQRVCRIIRGGDLQRSRGILSVHIDGYCSPAI